jgi:hypothetical protein
LEIVVVVVEWRMLVWAVGGSSLASRRLLVVSVTMITTSCVAGVALSRMLFAAS